MNDIQEKLPRWDHVCLKDGMLAKIQKNVGAKMLPFQWRALNDEIPDIEKSHCIENFRIAAGRARDSTMAWCSRIATWPSGWRR